MKTSSLMKFVAAVCVGPSAVAGAVDRRWTGFGGGAEFGFWDNASNWTGGQLLAAGDSVLISDFPAVGYRMRRSYYLNNSYELDRLVVASFGHTDQANFGVGSVWIRGSQAGTTRYTLSLNAIDILTPTKEDSLMGAWPPPNTLPNPGLYFGRDIDLDFPGGLIWNDQRAQVFSNGYTTLQFVESKLVGNELVKQGPGGLGLRNITNDFFGIDVQAGFLVIYEDATLGAGPLKFRSGTVIRAGGPVNRMTDNAVQIYGPVQFGAGDYVLTFSGPVSLMGASRVITVVNDAGETFDLTFSGVISNGGMVKAGTGRLLLSNAGNTYAGGLTINAGEVRVNAAGALGSTSSNVTFNNGALEVASTGLFSRQGGVVVNSGGTGTVNVQSSTGRAVFTAGVSGGGSLTKSGPGTLESSRYRSSALTIAQGTVIVTPDGSSSGTSVLQTLTLAGGSTPSTTFDITNNAVVIDYTGTSPLTTHQAQIISAYASGAWTGLGITSSNALNHPTDSTGVGYAEASALNITSFAGQTVDSSSVLIRYTWYGDSTLDQAVEFTDLLINAQNYDVPGTYNWSQGDSNYDGVVDFQDLLLLSQNYGKTAATLQDSDSTLPGPAIVYLELYHSFPHVIDDARNHEELWALFKPWEYLTSGASEFVYVPMLPTLMPEPGTMALVMGAGAIGLTRRRATVR